ncbi:MAG: hypothetical protein U9N02_04705 [Campylobacterota bacterium]|nr:hypothetical protein [Campylobacterota bacterium]
MQVNSNNSSQTIQNTNSVETTPAQKTVTVEKSSEQAYNSKFNEDSIHYFKLFQDITPFQLSNKEQENQNQIDKDIFDVFKKYENIYGKNDNFGFSHPTLNTAIMFNDEEFFNKVEEENRQGSKYVDGKLVKSYTQVAEEILNGKAELHEHNPDEKDIDYYNNFLEVNDKKDSYKNWQEHRDYIAKKGFKLIKEKDSATAFGTGIGADFKVYDKDNFEDLLNMLDKREKEHFINTYRIDETKVDKSELASMIKEQQTLKYEKEEEIYNKASAKEKLAYRENPMSLLANDSDDVIKLEIINIGKSKTEWLERLDNYKTHVEDAVQRHYEDNGFKYVDRIVKDLEENVKYFDNFINDLKDKWKTDTPEFSVYG